VLRALAAALALARVDAHAVHGGRRLLHRRRRRRRLRLVLATSGREQASRGESDHRTGQKWILHSMPPGGEDEPRIMVCNEPTCDTLVGWGGYTCAPRCALNWPAEWHSGPADGEPAHRGGRVLIARRIAAFGAPSSSSTLPCCSLMPSWCQIASRSG